MSWVSSDLLCFSYLKTFFLPKKWILPVRRQTWISHIFGDQSWNFCLMYVSSCSLFTFKRGVNMSLADFVLKSLLDTKCIELFQESNSPIHFNIFNFSRTARSHHGSISIKCYFGPIPWIFTTIKNMCIVWTSLSICTSISFKVINIKTLF